MRSKWQQSAPLDKATILTSQSHWFPFPPQRSLYSSHLDHQLQHQHQHQQQPAFTSRAWNETAQEMAAAMATSSVAILNPKCFIPTPKITPSSKPLKHLPLQALPKGLTAAAAPSALTGTALAGAIFSTLSTASPALAVQQLAEIADGDSRGLALLLPLIPAILWVLYNILQPALNQLEKMRSSKGVIVGLGLGGLAATGFFHPPEASAGEIAALAEAATDNRGQLLLFVISPAILWVLYNILQPALNQLEKMRSQ